MDKIVEQALKVLAAMQNITFQMIVKATVAVIVGIILYSVFENRVPIQKAFLRPPHVGETKLSEPTKETKDSVQRIVNSMSFVGAAQLVNANFRTNERIVVYTYSDNAEITAALNEYMSHRVAPVPLFLEKSREGAIDNNERMVSIINGQFSCYDFDKTVAARNLPGMKKDIKMLCSLSIPPYFGYFSGYITLYVTDAITADQMDDLRAAARMLSSDIYEREFLK